MIKNFVAKLLRTPQFKQKKVESKKKYKRKNIMVRDIECQTQYA